MTGRTRWARTTIALTTTTGPRRVQASTYGAWAVHMPLSGPGVLNFAWAVTHVPTGLSVGHGFPKSQARRLCQRLHRIVGDREIDGAGLEGLPEPVAREVRGAVLDAHGIERLVPRRPAPAPTRRGTGP